MYIDFKGDKVTDKDIKEDIELAEFIANECKGDKNIDVLKELQKIRQRYAYFVSGKGRKTYHRIDMIVGIYLELDLRLYKRLCEDYRYNEEVTDGKEIS